MNIYRNFTTNIEYILKYSFGQYHFKCQEFQNVNPYFIIGVRTLKYLYQIGQHIRCSAMSAANVLN